MRPLVNVLLVAAVVLGGLKLLVMLAEPRMAFFPMPGEDVTPRQLGANFIAVDVATVDGETLHAWWLPRAGAKAQVVYFHGNGGNLSLWSPVVVGLQARGFSVFAIDYRGYGRSTGRPSEQGLYKDVDATIGVFNERVREAKVPVVYWGRSLGACMAAHAAARRPPDGVVLEAGFPDARQLLGDYPVMWLLSWFSSYRFPTAEWMGGVKTPALVMHGTNDSVVAFRHGQALYDQLTGEKTFVAIEGGDHNELEPPDPTAYWNAVDAFVASLRSR